jgi:hypothetical protein
MTAPTPDFPNFRALCAELTKALDAELDLFETRHSELLERASAALATPTPEPLSSAAQAVLDAWVENTLYAPIDNEPLALAAALCAIADQVVPANGSRKNNEIRAELLAIATELEAL